LRHALELEAARGGPAEAGHGEPIRRVLLVDDDADIRHILDLLLTHAGFDVVEAVDGEEALSRAMEARPHAVVADVQMPNMDGIELVHRLRALPDMQRTPVLLFTGRPPQDELHGILALDRVRYMSKGDPRKIAAAIEDMLADTVPARAWAR
jgi:two-component system chemotaxis response regulator CheY